MDLCNNSTFTEGKKLKKEGQICELSREICVESLMKEVSRIEPPFDFKVLKKYSNFHQKWKRFMEKEGLHSNRKEKKTKKIFPTVTGLEPAIPRSEVWCLIH